MRKALSQFWTALTTFFAAFEQLSQMLLSLCTTGAIMSKGVEETAQAERIASRKAMEAASGYTLDGEALPKLAGVKK